jgi:hypothetical protein
MSEDDEAPPSCRGGGKRATTCTSFFAEAVQLRDFDWHLADALSKHLRVARQRRSAALPAIHRQDRAMIAVRMLVYAATTAFDSDLPGILTCIKLLVAYVDLKSCSNMTLHGGSTSSRSRIERPRLLEQSLPECRETAISGSDAAFKSEVIGGGGTRCRVRRWWCIHGGRVLPTSSSAFRPFVRG